MTRHYRLFDLIFTSDLDLPHLLPVDEAGDGDVRIRLGPLPANLPVEEGDYPIEGGLLVVIEDAGRFMVTGGTDILIEPFQAADPANVRLFLLGSAMGALLYQRGLLPLHANAVVVEGRAVAFSGRSGSGKSTLAAWCHDHGHAVFADDVAAVDHRGGRAVLLPGLQRLRLWRSALEASGRQAVDHQQSYVGDSDYDKYDVVIDRSVDDPVPLAAIYLLEAGDRFSIEPLSGMEAVDALVANSYRGEFVGAMDLTHDHLARCISIAREVPVFRARRPWGLERLDEACAGLLEHARGLR